MAAYSGIDNGLSLVGWHRLEANCCGCAVTVGLTLSHDRRRQNPSFPPPESIAPPITASKYPLANLVGLSRMYFQFSPGGMLWNTAARSGLYV